VDLTRAYGRKTGGPEYRDCEIGVKCFFRFAMGQERGIPPKGLVGRHKGIKIFLDILPMPNVA